MPQLELQHFPPQLIWLAISFIALYIVMARVALPRIATVIEERRGRIAADLDQAAELKRKTDEAIAAYEQALAEARARAHGIARETREALAGEVEAEKARIETEIAGKVADAEQRIARAKSDALANIGEVAGDAAGAIVQELIGAKLAKTEINQAVAKALAS